MHLKIFIVPVYSRGKCKISQQSYPWFLFHTLRKREREKQNHKNADSLSVKKGSGLPRAVEMRTPREKPASAGAGAATGGGRLCGEGLTNPREGKAMAAC